MTEHVLRKLLKTVMRFDLTISAVCAPKCDNEIRVAWLPFYRQESPKSILIYTADWLFCTKIKKGNDVCDETNNPRTKEKERLWKILMYRRRETKICRSCEIQEPGRKLYILKIIFLCDPRDTSVLYST